MDLDERVQHFLLVLAGARNGTISRKDLPATVGRPEEEIDRLLDTLLELRAVHINSMAVILEPRGWELAEQARAQEHRARYGEQSPAPQMYGGGELGRGERTSFLQDSQEMGRRARAGAEEMRKIAHERTEAAKQLTDEQRRFVIAAYQLAPEVGQDFNCSQVARRMEIDVERVFRFHEQLRQLGFTEGDSDADHKLTDKGRWGAFYHGARTASAAPAPEDQDNATIIRSLSPLEDMYIRAAHSQADKWRRFRPDQVAPSIGIVLDATANEVFMGLQQKKLIDGEINAYGHITERGWTIASELNGRDTRPEKHNHGLADALLMTDSVQAEVKSKPRWRRTKAVLKYFGNRIDETFWKVLATVLASVAGAIALIYVGVKGYEKTSPPPATQNTASTTRASTTRTP